MSWHFSRALAAEFSALTCSDGAPSAPSKSIPMPALPSRLDKMTELFAVFQFGMTCELLTDCPGADAWMSSLADSPAKTSALQGGGAGLAGERSGLWREFARIIREVRPRFVFVENSPALTGRGLGRVLGDLAALGYDAQWGVLGAADVGAPHKRDRIWIVANSDRVRQLQPQGGVEVQRRRSGDCGREMGAAAGSGLPLGAILPLGRPEPESKPQRPSSEALGDSVRSGCEELNPTAVTERPGFDSGEPAGWWAFDPGDDPESGVGRVVNGLAYRVDRIAALGNGQVPAVAATAFTQLKELT